MSVAAAEALLDAATRGDVDTVRALTSSAGVPLASGHLDAALVAAAAAGHLPTVQALHDGGADVRGRGGEALPLAAAAGHGDDVRYLHAHGAEHSLLSRDGRRRIEAMREEVQRAPALYRPSRIWEFLADINSTMLGWGGEEHFKRTVNQNYFNFIPTSWRDPRILNLARLWLRHPTLAHRRYAIENPDRDPARWCSWDERYFVFKDNHDERLRLYKWFVACLHEYGLRSDRRRLLARIEEPPLGNPIRVWRDGRLVSQDLVNSVRERNLLVDGFGDPEATPRRTVAELGPGYGRLAHVVMATTRYRYFVFDIPPALYIAEWYLTRLFPDRRVFRFRPFADYGQVAEELEAADLAFFTPNQLEAMPDAFFDGFVTISSLQEMRPEQIRHFMTLMASKSTTLLYLKQHRDYVNPWDDLRIRRSDYRLPDGWAPVSERADLLNPGFFELLAARRPR